MPNLAWVNGRFMPLDQAVVPVEDRGYQFGDGVYEVIRTYRGEPFQFDAHLGRLERSAEAIALSLPFRRAEWQQLIAEGLEQAGHTETKIYLQVTRGVAARDHAFPANTPPTVVLTFREMQPLAAAVSQDGVRALTLEDQRWGRCDIKSVNLLPNLLARQRAKEAGAFEAILLRDGLVTEGSVSNVAVVSAGRLATAPEGPRILSGVTRAVVLELARKDGISVEERFVTSDELRRADEIFLCGTTVEVLPVVQVDESRVGTGQAGPISRRLSLRFKETVNASRKPR